MCPCRLRSDRARALRHPRARRPGTAPRRGRGAHRGRHPGLRDRRARRSRLCGGEAPGPQRDRVGAARVAAEADHGQPCTRRPAQGGLGVRPLDRAGSSRGLAADPGRPARRARRSRRAGAGRPRAAGPRCVRRRRRRAACGSRPDPLCARVGLRGRAGRSGGDPGPASRRGRCLSPRRAPAAAGGAARRSGRARSARLGGRSRPGARPPRTRARRRRRPQPAAGRPARDGQDHAGPAIGVDPAPARAAGGARGDADPLGRGRAAARAAADHAPALPGAAPQRLDGGDRRRRRRAATGRGEPRASRRAPPRRAAGVPAAGSRGAAPAARGRCRLGRPRSGSGALSGPVPADRDDESVSVRRAGRSGGRVLVLDAASGGVPRQALAGAARSLRPGRDGAAAAGGGACGRTLGVLGARARPGRGWPRSTRGDAAPANGGGRRAAQLGPSSGCRSRDEAVRGSLGLRGPPPRSPAPTPCSPSTSPKRSPTARRRSSRRERARARILRSRQ